jgi:beta-aspartyl-dipeptidase (metallo-type)
MSGPLFLLIEGGEVYAPEPLGRADVLIAGGKIARVGGVDRKALDRLGVPWEAIDAAGRLVVPGLIDPHEHLQGGSGEGGFRKQTPEIRVTELVAGGITTVVGCLGVDTTTKTMPGLLGRAKALREDGITAFVWTGGYNVPPTTLLEGVREDITLVAEVVGAGEIAISDARSTDPDVRELARLVHDAAAGGLLAGKAGLTHFHVGDRPERLAVLRQLLDGHDVKPEWLYPTHVERTEPLMREAVELAKRGCRVDVDVVEGDLAKWLKVYLDAGGPPERLTASSDASITPPKSLFDQVRSCVTEHGFELADVLRHVTSNTADILKLPNKGRLAEWQDADVLVLERGSMELVEVIAGGRRMMRGGRAMVQEPGER